MSDPYRAKWADEEVARRVRCWRGGDPSELLCTLIALSAELRGLACVCDEVERPEWAAALDLAAEEVEGALDRVTAAVQQATASN